MGLTCTHFSSPTASSTRGNHSCAPDLAAMARAVLRSRGWRGSCSGARPCCRSRSRAAALPLQHQPAAARALPRHDRRQDRLHGRRRALPRRDRAARTQAARRGAAARADPGRQARRLLDRGFRFARSRPGIGRAVEEPGGATPRSVYRRRRLVAAAASSCCWPASAWRPAAFSGDGEPRRALGAATAARRRSRAELPRGGRRVLPDNRVVAFYGAPQSRELGALGIGTPDRAARRLDRQARAYARGSRPVLPAHGADRGHRARRRRARAAVPHPPARCRHRALPARRAARRMRCSLLDIQPGRSDFFTETTRLERWLREPDVGLALDPEWRSPPARSRGR